jgi:hypothetical protein
MSNSFSLTAFVGADAEIKYLTSGKILISTRVAFTPQKPKQGEEEITIWVTLDFWAKSNDGEDWFTKKAIAIKKGDFIHFSGRISQMRPAWNEKQMKPTLYMSVTVDDFHWVDRSRNGAPAPVAVGVGMATDDSVPF